MISFSLSAILAFYIAKRHTGPTRYWLFPVVLLVALLPIKYTAYAIANGQFWQDAGFVLQNGVYSLAKPQDSPDTALPVGVALLAVGVATIMTAYYKGMRRTV